MFEDGVTYYTRGRAEFNVFFPEDKVVCKWCRFCRHDNGEERHVCRLTNEILYEVNKTRGRECPIYFEVTIDE